MTVRGAIAALTCDNETSEAATCVNTKRPLTHSSDLSREGLAVEPTQLAFHFDRVACVKCGNAVKTPRRGMCRRCHEDDLSRRRAAGPIDGRVKQDPLDRILSRIDIGDGCWLWTGQISSDGYGSVWLKPQKRPAHAVVWTLVVGPIANGLELDHLCRVRNCVNPDHLEPVTHAENMRRAQATRSVQ